jgi:DNA-binding GntR family transcriptional regulator
MAADEWQSGDMLPTVSALADHYQVGRGTVSRALRRIADDGLLVIRERWGTFHA